MRDQCLCKIVGKPVSKYGVQVSLALMGPPPIGRGRVGRAHCGRQGNTRHTKRGGPPHHTAWPGRNARPVRRARAAQVGVAGVARVQIDVRARRDRYDDVLESCCGLTMNWVKHDLLPT